MTPRPWQGPQPEPSAEELARGWRWVRDGYVHMLICGPHWCADVAVDPFGAGWQAWRATERTTFAERSQSGITLEQAKADAVAAVNKCGEWGRVVIDEPMCSRADFEAKVADAEARGAASIAYARGRDLVTSRHFKQLRRFLKATESRRGWMGALSVNAGGVDVVVDYAALRAIVADIERIGGEG